MKTSSIGLSQVEAHTIKQYNINSDVDSIYQSDRTNNFNIRIDLDYTQGVDRIAIGDVAIPKSYYIINSSNNTFIINEGGVSPITITLTQGNYNVTQLITELNRVCQDPPSVGLVGTYTWSLYSPNGVNSGKLQVQSNVATPNGTLFTFTNSLFEILGGYSPDDNAAGLVFSIDASSTEILPFIYNLNAYSNMYITCDLVAGNNTQNNSNILCAVYPHETSLFSYSVDEFDIFYKSKAISKKSDIINFKIINQFGEPIDFNGIAVSFSLFFFKIKN